ncbi:MAG: DUF962 domain-containing protein [Gammaproteobacteria bacterium]|nr:DUF962 domain-containing protein [Gammaproteobacteria bacterium]
MSVDGKLMKMLSGYAASHQHPFNIFVHMIGVPMIMLGMFIPLTWVGLDTGGFWINLAHAALIGFSLFYLTLDTLFAIVFFVFGLLIAQLAAHIGALPIATASAIAAAAFFGGYAAQFVGHAVEKSMPVLVKHPIQANLAAPFFTVVEMFRILGLRDELFSKVQRRIERQRNARSI